MRDSSLIKSHARRTLYSLVCLRMHLIHNTQMTIRAMLLRTTPLLVTTRYDDSVRNAVVDYPAHRSNDNVCNAAADYAAHRYQLHQSSGTQKQNQTINFTSTP